MGGDVDVIVGMLVPSEVLSTHFKPAKVFTAIPVLGQACLVDPKKSNSCGHSEEEEITLVWKTTHRGHFRETVGYFCALPQS